MGKDELVEAAYTRLNDESTNSSVLKLWRSIAEEFTKVTAVAAVASKTR